MGNSLKSFLPRKTLCFWVASGDGMVQRPGKRIRGLRAVAVLYPNLLSVPIWSYRCLTPLAFPSNKFENPQEANKFLLSSLFKSWQKKLEDQHNLTLLSLNNYVGGRNFITKTPFKTPEDLKGRRIRTPGAPVWQETIRSLGATPVALPWIETYPAFQQGVIDGAEAQHPATYGSKLHEVAKHITLTNHILLMNGLVVGTKWIRKLPVEYQQILVEEAVKAGQWTTKAVMDSEKEYERKMAAEGATIHTVDLAPFRVRADGAYKKLGFEDLRKEVNKILGK